VFPLVVCDAVLFEQPIEFAAVDPQGAGGSRLIARKSKKKERSKDRISTINFD
jgi:hypothetical protein